MCAGTSGNRTRPRLSRGAGQEKNGVYLSLKDLESLKKPAILKENLFKMHHTVHFMTRFARIWKFWPIYSKKILKNKLSFENHVTIY